MGDLNTSELSVGRALITALPFFVPYGTFLIAHDAKCFRPIPIVRWVVQGRSQAFVDFRNLVVGYVVGYLLTISENKFVLVR